MVYLLGCNSKEKMNTPKPQYLRWVGDSVHKDSLDAPGFHACNGDEQVLQYFNLGEGPVYESEKPALVHRFTSNYQAPEGNSQSGMVRIRFVVNCGGKAGRFRIIQSDENYEPFEFDTSITDQLLNITKSIENWKIQYREETPVDYYMYLVFKIRNGQITEILP